MTMFLIQALLWLLVAFLLGYGIGRFLKGLFCQQRQDHERDVSVPASLKPAQTVAVATGTAAAVATLAQVREKLNANADLPDVSVQAPRVDLPEVAVAAPEVALSVPEVAGQAVPDINVQLPDVEGIDVPEVDLPDMTLQAPALDVDVPVVDVDVPTVEVGLPEVDVTLPAVEVSLPDVPVDLPEASVVDTGLDWLDAAKAAVIAGGAGLVAKAAAAGDAIQDVLVGEAGDDGEDESDWLLLLVQQAKAAYQGKNLHAVSELWHSGSGYDCSALDRYETLALLPSQYDKLGSSHCGVPKAGFVAVGGDVSDIEQGMAVLFHYPNIVVCRDVDDNHHFIRVMA
ncbi:MAG: hypothetical protein JG718_06035 [Candidatus Thiothrix moscowensis]|nr:hypothetical protein [Candidatus Thiothrix moscowensis]